MKKIFYILYNIISSKLFKFCMVLGIFGFLFYTHFDKNYIDKEKLDEIISIIKKDKHSSDKTKDIKNNENKNIKKDIVPEKIENNEAADDETLIMEKDDGTLNNITNIVLKFKVLEENYKNKLKNNKIDYKRKIKYNDFIYYNNSVVIENINKIIGEDIGINNQVKQNNSANLFIKITKGDLISSKFIGKKIGDTVEYTQEDLINTIPEEYREQIKDNIKNIIKKSSTRIDKNIFDSKNIKYKIKILDFIDEEDIKKMELD